MLTAPRITIEEIRDEPEPYYSEFTPEDRRVFARELKVEAGKARVTLAEADRDDPTTLFLDVWMDTGDIEELAGWMNVAQLDTMIEVLTLARDVAICEGMIEPSAG